MWGHLHPTVGLPQRPAADLFIAERCTRKAAPVDGPRSGSRPLAQAEVLRALRRVFPDPLIELAQIARTLPAGPRFDRRQFDDLNDQLDARRAVHFMLLFGSAARQHSSKRPISRRWRRNDSIIQTAIPHAALRWARPSTRAAPEAVMRRAPWQEISLRPSAAFGDHQGRCRRAARGRASPKPTRTEPQ